MIEFLATLELTVFVCFSCKHYGQRSGNQVVRREKKFHANDQTAEGRIAGQCGSQASFLLWQSHFEPEKMRKSNYRLGLRKRILGGDANWMFGMVRGDQLPQGQRCIGKFKTVGSFLWKFGSWTRDDSFLWNDSKPFFVDFKQMARKFGSQTFDIIGNTESQDNPR